MKNRLLLWGCSLLLLTCTTVLQSWTPLNTNNSVFAKVVTASQTTVINEAVAQKHIDHLLKLDRKSSLKKKNSVSGITINYSVSQYGTPYLDANLDIRVYDTLYNWVDGDFLFWTDSKSFSNLPYTKLILEVYAPIFDQWVSNGTHTFKVEQCGSISNYTFNLSNSVECSNLHYQSAYLDWATETPDYYRFGNYYIPIDIANGDIINVTVVAVP